METDEDAFDRVKTVGGGRKVRRCSIAGNRLSEVLTTYEYQNRADLEARPHRHIGDLEARTADV